MVKFYTNFWITWQHIQMKWSNFMLQTWFYTPKPMRHIWMNQNHTVALQDVFLTESTLKICAGLPKCPNKCKWQHLKKIAASAAEEETRGCFVTGIYVIIIQNTLEKIGHTQPIIQVRTDNTTAAGTANNTIKKQQSRATNMQYFWIHGQKTLKDFLIAWKSGQGNLANYLTKYHSANIINLYVPYIYIQLKLQDQPLSPYLRLFCKSVLIQRIPRWDNYTRHLPFPE